MSISLNFNNIREIDDSRKKGFEELCCQLARHWSEVPDGAKFIRKDDPDAGIECYWKLPSGKEWGLQAKLYRSRPDSGQWQNIKNSLTTALEKHPDLEKYIVCLATDREDPRKEEEEWFMDEWDSKVEKWTELAEDEGIDIEFEYWGSSRIRNFLSQDHLRGRLYFWFDSEQLTDRKLENEVEKTVSNANDRYTPELHVDVNTADTFEPLGRTPQFVEDVRDRLEELDEKTGKLFTGTSIKVLKKADEEAYSNLRGALEEIPILLQDTERPSDEIPIEELQAACEQADEQIRAIEPELRSLKDEADEEKDAAETTEKSTLHHFRQLRRTLLQFQGYVENSDLKIAEKSAVKLLGEAGVGKTHLLCNVAETRIENGHPTVLLLGEHFTNRDVWTQVTESLGLDCTTEEFLGALDSFGESRGVRSLVMIDALNESSDPRIWKNRLPGLVKEIEKYPHVGLCVSCRSGYEDLVISNSVDDDLVEVKHNGFREVEYEAVRRFFDEHGIEHSSIPILRHEFQIPLFLKLFCENLENQEQSRISHGSEGVSEIFEGYVDRVNSRLCEELDYDPGDNLVRDSIEDLAREMAEQGEGTKRLSKDTAKEIVNSHLPGRSYSDSLYANIVSEGVISEVVSPMEDGTDETVRFSYDKFADHMLAQQYIDLYGGDDFEDEISENEELQEIFENPRLYAGLLEAFAIHLAEEENVEIFKFVDSDDILTPFIKSLGWRKPQTLANSDNELKTQIEEYLCDEIELLDELHELWRVYLILATSSDHPLNAERLHETLMDIDVAGRDHDWSKFLHNEWRDETSEVFRLINWGFSLKNNPVKSRELKHLMSITLSWFLSCPNRFVRDRSTKAIVNVVDDDLAIYNELIKRFQEVNDPYILERVYAAAYGGILRHRERESVTEVADTVYELEFEDNAPTPHLLTRDYARGVIELADRQNSEYEVNMDKARPPYDSSFSIEVPSPDELRDQVQSRLEDADTDLNTRFWYGLAGSDFEGTGTSDFARYIVGTNHSRNDVHGYNFTGDKALRWITKRVFDLGWHPDAFGKFDDHVNRRNRGRMENRRTERFSKKYQWIGYYELVSWITDNSEFPESSYDTSYDGPWSYYNRDIDPSVLDPDGEPTRTLDDPHEYDCRADEVPTDEWVSDHEEFPDIPQLLDLSVEDEDWIPLHTVYKWRAAEDSESRLDRDVFLLIDAVIVENEDKPDLLNWLKDNWVESDEIGSRLVSLPTFTQTFRGEYPWHPSVADEFEEDQNPIRGLSLDIHRTTAEMLWESEYDCSIKGKYGMFSPSPYLCDLLDLEWAIGTEEFVQESADPVRVANLSDYTDPMDRINSLSMIAANNSIVDALESQGLSLVWIIQGEKRLITDLAADGGGQSQIRAAYALNDEGEFDGEVQSDFFEYGD
jgi:hypothetical protein